MRNIEPPEPTIRPGHALVWCRTCSQWEGWEVLSEEDTQGVEALKKSTPSNYAYVWDEDVQGQTMHIFRNRVTGHRMAQPPIGHSWKPSTWFNGNPHMK
jgi:hypothetical protein